MTCAVNWHISSTVICQASTSCYNDAYVVHYCTFICQALCKDFSLLSVLVSIIILHVSYQLFWWFHSIFCLKVCAVISCLCTTEYSADRFPTRAIKLPMYYGVALIDF